MSQDFADEKRAAIHEVVEAQNPYVEAGAILTGWTLLAEWVDHDGRYQLTKISSKDLPAWREGGYLHTALYQQAGEFVEDEDGDA